jgi:hypothetical protein
MGGSSKAEGEVDFDDFDHDQLWRGDMWQTENYNDIIYVKLRMKQCL